MIKNCFVYLSGSIQKSHSKNSHLHWTDEHMSYLSNIGEENGIHLVFLNPANRSDDLSDELSLFGRDMLQVYLSDYVLVDGREKRGIGIGYEIAFANQMKIPVISWVPNDSHYRPKELVMLGQHLTNWCHPFLKAPSQCIAENLDEAIKYIFEHKRARSNILSSEDFVFPAIVHYLKTQLSRDKEMYDLINAYQMLQEKIDFVVSVI